MRFIVMHKTNAHWEAGAVPTPDLIARVGALLGELANAGVLLGAEGLRASSQGVRLRFSAGRRTAVAGPFQGGNELPAGFDIVRAGSIDDVVEWASRQAEVLGDGEVDIRPVTEPWDIGMGSKPADAATRRYMVLRKATGDTEAGVSPSSAQQAELSTMIRGAAATCAHVVGETMRPSARGRRYRNAGDGITVLDGPFTESKELIGGYVVISAESIEEADRLARRYIDVVGAEEVDVRELVERP